MYIRLYMYVRLFKRRLPIQIKEVHSFQSSYTEAPLGKNGSNFFSTLAFRDCSYHNYHHRHRRSHHHSTVIIINIIHFFIQAISIAPLKSTTTQRRSRLQHGYCVEVSHRSATGNCDRRTCPRSLSGGQSRILTHDPSDERR